eukprot:103173-Prymnesium_polylepis.1
MSWMIVLHGGHESVGVEIRHNRRPTRLNVAASPPHIAAHSARSNVAPAARCAAARAIPQAAELATALRCAPVQFTAKEDPRVVICFVCFATAVVDLEIVNIGIAVGLGVQRLVLIRAGPRLAGLEARREAHRVGDDRAIALRRAGRLPAIVHVQERVANFCEAKAHEQFGRPLELLLIHPAVPSIPRVEPHWRRRRPPTHHRRPLWHRVRLNSVDRSGCTHVHRGGERWHADAMLGHTPVAENAAEPARRCNAHRLRRPLRTPTATVCTKHLLILMKQLELLCWQPLAESRKISLYKMTATHCTATSRGPGDAVTA